MTNLLYIMRFAREYGWLGEAERHHLQSSYFHAWVIFLEVLGDEFAKTRGVVSIASDQIDEIEQRVKKVYAHELAMYQLRVAFRRVVEEALSTLVRAGEALRGRMLRR